MSVNKTILIGRVGKDPDVRTLQDGNIVANFTLATSERYKDRYGEAKESTEWHTISCWRGCAELAQKYVRKGRQLYVEGKIHYSEFTDRDGVKRTKTEIIAETLDFIGPKPQEDRPTPQSEPRILGGKPSPAEDPGDDLPFSQRPGHRR